MIRKAEGGGNGNAFSEYNSIFASNMVIRTVCRDNRPSSVSQSRRPVSRRVKKLVELHSTCPYESEKLGIRIG